MATITGQIAESLRPGVMRFWGEAKKEVPSWRKIYEAVKSDKGYEEFVETLSTPVLALKPQGSPTTEGRMAEKVKTILTHSVYALNYQITKEAIEDDLYKNVFKEGMKSLRKSAIETADLLAMNPFNTAFSAGVPLGDGQPLCSAVHPIDAGSYSNTTAINFDFSESSLREALIVCRRMKAQNGFPYGARGSSVLLAPELEYVANAILRNPEQTGTANRNISAVYAMNSIPKGIVVSDHLTNVNNWFLNTTADEGAMYVYRYELETSEVMDEDAMIIKYIVSSRYIHGFVNPRGVVGVNAL